MKYVKIYALMIGVFSLAQTNSISASSLNSDEPTKTERIKAFLKSIDIDFETANTDSDKASIVSQPIHKDNVLNFDPYDTKTFEANGTNYIVKDKARGEVLRKFNSDIVNPLVVAIFAQDSEKFKKWLPFVDANHVNLVAQSYRQPANLAHIATIQYDAFDFSSNTFPSRSEQIIHSLGQAGADFNFKPHGGQMGIYNNTTLTAYNISDAHTNPNTDRRVALAILYGADPLLGGSTRHFINDSGAFMDSDKDNSLAYTNAKNLLQLSFDILLETTDRSVFRYTDFVREFFIAEKEKRMTALEKLSF